MGATTSDHVYINYIHTLYLYSYAYVLCLSLGAHLATNAFDKLVRLADCSFCFCSRREEREREDKNKM